MPSTAEIKRPSPAPAGLDAKQKSYAKKKGLQTAACWAIGLFVAVNGALAVTGLDKKPVRGAASDSTRDLWSGTGSIDLAINGLAELKKRPTVMLLGSSLIMHPFWAMDAEKNPHLPDIFHYHGSNALEDKLAEVGAPKQRVYSLAIFGEMISDAYIYVNDFMKGDKKPDLLMFGIAPRDFSDSDLPAPMATFTFKRLVGMDNFPRYAESFLPGWNDKADFVASHSCFFYGKRWRLQHEVQRVVDRFYNLAGIPKDSGVVAAKADPDKNTAGFMLTGSAQERWSNSVKEYRRRYHGIGDKDLSIQEGFLDKVLAVCAERHIKVVLVNMPLSQKNRDLMPPEFYNAYRSKIATAAQRPDVKLLDLGDSPDFTEADFWDTAHLNHFGGRKLINHIAPAIAEQLNSH
ncbi:hypothetical protein BH10CYA1_BH10CYA1_16860 [soil metagenome]